MAILLEARSRLPDLIFIYFIFEKKEKQVKQKQLANN